VTENTFRTLKKAGSPVLRGMEINDNNVRPYEALKGRTPIEPAGIRVEGENKWMTLIQNASQEIAKS